MECSCPDCSKVSFSWPLLSPRGGGRTRESQVPAILEFLQIPYVGSDSTTIAVAHDKSLAKRLIHSHGLPTAPFQVFADAHEPLTEGLRFPLFVKPLHEGTSKGIHGASFCRDEAEVRATATRLIKTYRQPVLVEEFLPGREFTIGLLGNPPRALPIIEILFTSTEQAPIYNYEIKIDKAHDYSQVCPARLEAGLRGQIEALAVASFQALACRDVARVDIRLDRDGQPTFIELNPLPGLSPGFSDLATAALAAGLRYEDLIQQLVDAALQRLQLR